MKKCSLLLSVSLLLTFFLGTGLHAQRAEYHFDAPTSKEGFSVVRSENNALRVVHSVPNLAIDEITDNGYTGDIIEMNGLYLPADAGVPNLPANSRFVAIPNGSNAVLNIISVKKQSIQNVDLLPAAAIPLSNDDRPAEYTKDQSIYSKNGFYPAEPFQISKGLTIRGVETVTLSITPFQYNPVTKELIVYYDVVAEVAFEGGNGYVGEDRLRNPWWDNILTDNILNSSILPHIDYAARKRAAALNREEGCDYLIITPTGPAFAQWADTIKVFRQHQGISTKVVSITEVGGNTVAAIENYINNAYNTWTTPPAAVLLLGDYSTNAADGIISHTLNDHPGGYNPYISDNPFSDVNNDKLPDISFARITARNAAELQHMINKFLDYERNPPTAANFYDHPITAMGWQTERWFQLCSEVVNGFWEHELGKNPVRENAIYSGSPGGAWSSNPNTATVVNYFGPNGLNYVPANTAHLTDWGGNATRVNNSINSGAFMLQHRDHGFEGGWGEPDYTTAHLSGLNNEDLTFVLSINCLTGKFNYSSECFTEKFHRQEHGALGLIAATEVSYSFVNDVYVWGLFDNMWPQFMPAYGTNPAPRGILPAFANTAGKYFLQQSSWPYNPEHKNITYNLFHHHGDAFMTVYSEVPQELTVNHLPVLLSGLETFDVTANAGAMIALTVNDEIIGSAIAVEGVTSVPIVAQIPPVSVRVTVTLQNYYRYENVIECIPPSGPYMVYNEYQINDAAGNGNGLADYGETIHLALALRNVGSELASNVTVTASTTSPYVTLLDNNFTVGNVEAGATMMVADALHFTIADNVPNNASLAFTLSINSGSNDWVGQFSLPAYAPAFSVGSLTIADAQGNGNGRLDPGETVQLTIKATNTGQSTALNVNGLLSANSPYITISNPSAAFAQIEGGQEVSAVYTVQVAGNAPVGSVATFNYQISAGAYAASKDFTAKIGLVIEDFETGDFSQFPWTNEGNQAWQITNVDPYAGTYSVKSGPISGSQTSALLVQYEVSNPDSISFYIKVSSENNYDWLRFYIGSTQMGQWSGSVAWTKVVYPVTAGPKTFKWVYSKDNSVNSGQDCAWLDDIVLPASISTSAWAGNDMTICSNSVAQLNGTATSYNSLLWSTSGTGTFSNTGILNPVYTPSGADYQSGSVVLTLTANGAITATDVCNLFFSQSVTVNSGQSNSICPNESYTITDAVAANYSGLLWTTNGDGTFNDATALLPVYTPGAMDTQTGSVVLTLTASPLPGCASVSNSQTLTIYTTPTVEVGTDRELCAGNNSLVFEGVMATNYASITWSTLGDGTFDNIHTLNPIYTPGIMDEINGFVSVSLTAESDGGCGFVDDSLMVYIHALPSVQMPEDQIVCLGNEAMLEIHLTGTAPWTMTMAEPFQTQTIEATPFMMAITPTATTQLVATSIADAHCSAVASGQTTLQVVQVPMQPDAPQGLDTVDFNDGMTTTYLLTEVEFWESYTAMLTPENAGTVAVDGREVLVTWNIDFRGEASLTAMASNLCGQSDWSVAKTIEVKSTIGVDELKVGQIQIYPNPFSNSCTIEMTGFNAGTLHLQIIDITGKVVYNEVFEANATSFKKQLPLGSLAKGVYSVRVTGAEKSLSTKLIHR